VATHDHDRRPEPRSSRGVTPDPGRRARHGRSCRARVDLSPPCSSPEVRSVVKAHVVGHASARGPIRGPSTDVRWRRGRMSHVLLHGTPARGALPERGRPPSARAGALCTGRGSPESLLRHLQVAAERRDSRRRFLPGTREPSPRCRPHETVALKPSTL
jgi:hypothetical protein